MKIAKLKEQEVLDLGFEQPYEGEDYFTKKVESGLTNTSLDVAVCFEGHTIDLIYSLTGNIFWRTNDFTLLRLELILLFFELDNAFEE